MKKALLLFSATMVLSLAMVSCGETPEGEKVEAQDKVETTAPAQATGSTYTLDTESSKIDWVGGKLVGDSHNGYIKLSEGTLDVTDGNLSGGNFVIDMNSITDVDIEDAEYRQKLEGHLKSGDFFNVEAHPTATFEIAKVEAIEGNPDATHNITGNLTMKGITKSVVIPASVSMADNSIKATTPQFVIDRTQWEVMYGASALGLVKDKIIKDEVALKIELTAMAK